MFTTQTVCCIFINFVTIYKLRHRGRPEEALSWWARFKEDIRPFRNQVVPKLQFAAYYLLSIVLPIAMIVLFAWASYWTDLWQTLAAPWLLACVANNLMLGTYINYTVFMPIVFEAV